MDKKDDLDTLLKKIYKQVEEEVIPPKKECPDEALFGKYVHGKLHEEEIASFEEHLLSCSECLESLEAIRMVEHAEDSLLDVPQNLYEKAKEILQKELKKASLRPNRSSTRRIILLWDQIQDKIIRLTPNLEGIIPSKSLEFQIVRKLSQLGKGFGTFPYRTTIDVNEGKIFLKIYRSGKERFLAVKIFFRFVPKKIPTQIRVTLYKSDRIYSSVYLDDRGEAFFHQIKKGDYHLDFLEGKKIVESIEFSILTLKNEP